MLQTNQPRVAMNQLDTATIIEELRFINWGLKNTLKGKNALLNQALGMIRSWIMMTQEVHYGEMTEKQRKAVSAKATKIKGVIEKAVKVREAAMVAASPEEQFVLMNTELPFDTSKLTDDEVDTLNNVIGVVTAPLRAMIEMEAEANRYRMEAQRLFKKLPIWTEWGKDIRGVGPAMSYVIADTGDLWNYANPAKLWKRMGLAVMDGERQGQNLKGDKEKAIKHGYNKVRRSQVWQIGEAIIKIGGPYRDIYDARKKYELDKALERGQIIVVKQGDEPGPNEVKSIPANADKSLYSTAGQRHNRAKRYMEKKLLRDLWKAWRRTMPQPDTA